MIVKVYFVEYNDVSKVFFTSHHLGRSCALDHPYTNAIRGYFRATICSSYNPVMQVVYLRRETATDVHEQAHNLLFFAHAGA